MSLVFQSKEETETKEILDNRIKEIKEKNDWEQIAWSTKQYLEERLKGRHNT